MALASAANASMKKGAAAPNQVTLMQELLPLAVSLQFWCAFLQCLDRDPATQPQRCPRSQRF